MLTQTWSQLLTSMNCEIQEPTELGMPSPEPGLTQGGKPMLIKRWVKTTLEYISHVSCLLLNSPKNKAKESGRASRNPASPYVPTSASSTDPHLLPSCPCLRRYLACLSYADYLTAPHSRPDLPNADLKNLKQVLPAGTVLFRALLTGYLLCSLYISSCCNFLFLFLSLFLDYLAGSSSLHSCISSPPFNLFHRT